jgi:hypothetical protein
MRRIRLSLIRPSIRLTRAVIYVSTLIRCIAENHSPTSDSMSACNCPSRSNRTAKGGRYDRPGQYILPPAAYKAVANNSFHWGDSIPATNPFPHRIDTGHIPAVAVCSHIPCCNQLCIGHAFLHTADITRLWPYDSTIRIKSRRHLIESACPIDRRLGRKPRHVYGVHFISPRFEAHQSRADAVPHRILRGLRWPRYSGGAFTGGRHRMIGKPKKSRVQRHCSNGLARRVTHTKRCSIGTKPQQRIGGNRSIPSPRPGAKAVGEACMDKPSAALEVPKLAVAR